MAKFISTNWFNLISLAIMLVSMGIIYGKLETRVTYNENILKEIALDIKTMLPRLSVLEANK